MYPVIGALVVLAALFWYFGWKWESGLERPKFSITNLPLVSIIIPSFNSEKYIKDSILSAKNIDYPKKEILVADDCSTDRTTDICSLLGVPFVKNISRLGKANSLNNAMKKTGGEILLFLDADTTIDRNSLKTLIPWFSKPGIAVVVPKHITKNRHTLLGRLIAIENMFNSALYKAHMFFGSMLTFRGCCAAIKRETFEQMGGWPNTLIEDNEFASKLAKTSIIQYEPTAVAETIEAETIAQLKKQRMRWAKGTAYSFYRHHKEYGTHPLFYLQFFPYIMLFFAVVGLLFWQMWFLIPILPFYIVYAFSIKEIVSVSIIFLLPLFSSVLAVAMGGVSHLAITIVSEKNSSKSNAFYIFPYIFFFIPLATVFYIKGVISAVKDRRAGKPELDMDAW
jgi:biofilm PGA synthesis N-glycosyltransferase PgaC